MISLPTTDAADLAAKLDREGRFWDQRQDAAAARDPADYRVAATDRHDRSVPWLPYLGFPEYLDCVLDHLGPLAGRRVLDLGCGTGFLSCRLAAAGALVDAVDVSPASLETARWRAEVSGVADRIAFHNAPAEKLPFEAGRFDAACGVFVLHHLELAAASRELRRTLKPGAPAGFIETWGGNPLLMMARRLLPGRYGIERASSDDEAPLSPLAMRQLAETFGPGVRAVFPGTVFFRMLSYVPPLHRPAAQRILAGCDRAVGWLPPLRPWSYFAVIQLRAAP